MPWALNNNKVYKYIQTSLWRSGAFYGVQNKIIYDSFNYSICTLFILYFKLKINLPKWP